LRGDKSRVYCPMFMNQNTDQNQKTIQLAQAGLEEMQLELKDLIEVKLPAAIDRVAKAREYGDLTENSEYHSARDDQELLQTRIDQLQAIVENAEVVKSTQGSSKIGMGSKITLQKKGSQKKIEYSIAGEFEAEAGDNKISSVSPLGKALMGKKKGDKITVEVPAGQVEYAIIKIN